MTDQPPSGPPGYPPGPGHPPAPGYQPPPGAWPARPVAAPPAPPPRETWRAPSRVEAVPGTPFGVALPSVPPTASGPAIGSLVAGVTSILVSLITVCFGIAGGQAGWGGWVAGAFALLGGVLGLAAVGLGLVGRRQVRAGAGAVTGRGLAIAGLSCGGAGLLLTLGGLALALALQL